MSSILWFGAGFVTGVLLWKYTPLLFASIAARILAGIAKIKGE